MTEGCAACEGQSMEEIINSIERSIASPAKCGIIGVHGAKDDNTPPFHYTVGLSDMGWSELIVAGLAMDTGQHLLNGVVQRSLQDLGPPTEGVVVNKVVNFPLRFQSISDEQRDQYMVLAVKRQCDLTGMEPRALQVIFPDERGRYPDDPECDAKTAFVQQLPTDEQLACVQ